MNDESMMWELGDLLIFASIMIVTWFLFTCNYPRVILYLYKRAILVQGFGEGPIPVNTLQTESLEFFADPLHPPASASNLGSTGVNRDTLITIGWLNFKKGPLVLHVPEMNGRYYAVQFTNPSNNTVFAYVGRRTTGTQAGDYLITGPNRKIQAPSGMKQISSPNNSVLVVGRVLVECDIVFQPLTTSPSRFSSRRLTRRDQDERENLQLPDGTHRRGNRLFLHQLILQPKSKNPI